MSETRAVQVVVAYDLSPSGEIALARAVEVVARAPQHVLHVVTVVEKRVGVHKVSYEQADHMQETVRDHVGAAFNGRPTAAEIQFFIHCPIGKPVDEILRIAETVGADLLFIGSHNKVGIERVLLGSTSERVVREARCPVMVARQKAYPTVDLLKVVRYDHEHAAYQPPHRYSYVETRLISRPNDWPLN